MKRNEKQRFPIACQSGRQRLVGTLLSSFLHSQPPSNGSSARASVDVAKIEKKPIMSPYTTPLWAVQVTALPSFCPVLILSVSSASSTPSFIGSTLWVWFATLF